MKWPAVLAVLLSISLTAGLSIKKRHVGDSFKCSTFCKVSENNNFNYKTGYTYTYNYTATTLTSITGTSLDGSRLLITAKADVHVLSRCELVLQLRDVTLDESISSDLSSHSRSSQEFARSLERKSMMFSYTDGKIENICPHWEEETWAVNFKRGILSTLQNSMKDLTTDQTVEETDVTGTCETIYTLTTLDGSDIAALRKTKNMLTCSNRVDHFLSLPLASDNIPSKSLPLIRSQHECTQVVNDKKIIQLSSCEESHLFRPFSNGDNGASTKVTQSLVLYETCSMRYETTDDDELRDRTTLQFQHEDAKDEENSYSAYEHVTILLNELNDKMKVGVEADIPKMFSDLVENLKKLEYYQLFSITSNTTQKHARKFLLDGMFVAGTPSSMSVIINLHESHDISDEEFDEWLSSLTFQTKPTADMILAVSPILDTYPKDKAFLGISSLVHNFCVKNAGCQNNDAVMTIVTNIEKYLENDCQLSSREEERLVLLALKAIGNIGVVINSPHYLQKCYEAGNSMEVRLAAISAYRRLSCDSVSRVHLLHTYSDMKEDTEVRIGAYLAVMRCPNLHVIQSIKETLYNEDVNQVASFVWTHLTNLQETSSPNKQGLKELLSNEFLQNKFHTDVRKFSRNYEASLFSDTLNAGGTVESNVIFTPQSYLPRSAMVNLTVDLFGQSVNFFEIGGRAEGLEQYVEDFFGPGGYFPDNSLKTMLQKIRGKSKKSYEDMAGSIKELVKSFDAKSRLEKPLKANIYSRVLGNEIFYNQFESLSEIVDGISSISSPMEIVSNFLKNQNVDYTKSLVFMDTSYVIPTCIGLPLEFVVNGSATISSKMNSKVDMSNIWREGNLNIEGDISPSAAIEFTSSMAIDAQFAKTGIKTVSTLHSNTFISGKLKLQGGELVDVKLDFPREKMEILNVSSKLFVIHGTSESEQLKEVDGIIGHKESMSACSPSFISTLFGVKLCGEISYQNASSFSSAPYFPFTGPFKTSVSLDKTDTFDSYELTYKSINDRNHVVYLFNMDTPGSKIDRKFKFLYSLDSANKALKVNAVTPFFKIEADGKISDSNNGKQIDLQIFSNDEEIFLAHSSVMSSISGNIAKYESSLSLSVMEKQLVGMKGKISCISGSKYRADFTMIGLTNNPIVISGDLNTEMNRYDMSATVKSDDIDGSFHGSIRYNEGGIMTKGTIHYSRESEIEQVITFLGKLQSERTGQLLKQVAQLSLQTSAYPQYNMDTYLSWQYSQNFAEVNAKLGLGDVVWYAQYLKHFQQSKKNTDFKFLTSLSCPKKNIEFKIDIKHQITDAGVLSHFLLQTNTHNRIYGSLKYLNKPQSKLYYKDLEAQLEIPLFNGSAKGSVVEESKGNYVAQVNANWFLFGHSNDISINGNYNDFLINKIKGCKAQLHVNGTVINKASVGFEIIRNNWELWTDIDYEGKIVTANLTYLKNSAHSIKANVGIDKQVFGMDVTFKNSDGIMTVDVDLKAIKRYTLDCQLKSTPDEQTFIFEVQWDKNNDPKKKLHVSAHLKENEKTALIEIPNQYIMGKFFSLPDGMRSMVEWAKDKKIELTYLYNYTDTSADFCLEILTPFISYKNQKIFGNYVKNEHSVDIKVNATWGEEQMNAQIILGNTNSTSGEQVMWIIGYLNNTSIHPYLLNIDLKHTVLDEEVKTINTELKISAGDKKIQFESHLEYNDYEIAGDVLLNTPYDGLSNLGGSVKSSLNEESFDFGLNIFWKEDKHISVDIIGETGSKIHGSLKITTPFKFYETTEVNFLHDRNPSVSHFKMHLQVLKYIVAFVMDKETGLKLMGSGTFSSPFSRVLNFQFAHSLQHGKVEELLSASYGDKKLFTINLYGYVQSISNNIDVTLSSEIQRHKMESRLNIQRNENHIHASVNVMLNHKVIALRFNGTKEHKNSRNYIHCDAVLSATFLENNITLEFTHTSGQGESYTSIDVPGMFNALHSLKVASFFNWKHDLSFTMSGLNININQEVVHQHGLSFMVKSLMNWNNAEVTFNYEYLVSKDSKTANGNLKTPWTDPMMLRFNYFTNSSLSTVFTVVGFSDQDKRKIKLHFETVSVGMLESGKVNVDLISGTDSENLLNGIYQIDRDTVALTTEWHTLKFDISAVFKCRNDFHKGSVTIKTPIANFEQLNFSGLMKMSNELIQFGISVKKGNESQSTVFFDETDSVENLITHMMHDSLLSIMGTVTINNKYINIDLNSTNSLFPFKEFSFQSHYKFESVLKQSLDLLYKIDNNMQHIFYGEYEFSEENLFNSGSALFSSNLPFTSASKIFINFQYDLKDGFIKSSFEFNNDKFDGVLSFSDKNFLLSVDSTNKILSHLSLSLQHDSNYHSNYFKSLKFMYNENILEISSTVLNPNEDSISAAVEMKTSLPEYELMKAEYRVSGINDKYKNGVAYLIKNDQRLEVSGEISTDLPLRTNGFITINTPFTGYELFKLGFSFTTSNKIQLYENTNIIGSSHIYFETESDKKEVIVNFTLQDRSVSGEIRSSYPGYEFLKFTGKITPKTDGMFTDIQIIHNNNNVIKIKGLFSMSILSSGIKVEMLTPIQGYEYILFNNKHNLKDKLKTFSSLLTINDENIFELSFSGLAEITSGYFNLSSKTPFKKYEEIYFHGNYEFSNRYSIQFVQEKNGNKTELSSSLSFNKDEAVLTFVTPLQGLEHVELYNKYNIKDNGFIIMNLEVNDNLLFNSTLLMSKYSLLYTLQTPFSICQDLSISMNMKRSDGNKNKYTLYLDTKKDSLTLCQMKLDLNLDSDTIIEVNYNMNVYVTNPVDFNFNISYMPQSPLSSFKLSAMNNERKLIFVESSLNNITRNGYTTNIMINIGTLKSEIVFQYYPEDILVFLLANVEGITYEPIRFESKFSYVENPDGFNLLFVTPMKDFKEFSLMWRNKDGNVELTLRTPIKNFEKLSLLGKITSDLFVLSAYRNEEFIKTEIKYYFRYHMSNITLYAELPRISLNKLQFSVIHNIENEAKTFGIELKSASETYSLYVKLRKDYLSPEIFVKLTMPSLFGIKDSEFKLSYDVKLLDNSHFTVYEVFNGERLFYLGLEHRKLVEERKFSLQLSSSMLQSSLAVNGKYNVSQNYAAEVNLVLHDGRKFSMAGNISDDWMDGALVLSAKEAKFISEIKLNWKVANDPHFKEISLVLDLPYKNKYAFSFVLQPIDIYNINTYFYVLLGKDVYNSSLQWNFNDAEKYTAVLNVKWPKQQILAIQADITFSKEITPTTILVSYNCPYTLYRNIQFATILRNDGLNIGESFLEINDKKIFVFSSEVTSNENEVDVEYTLESVFTEKIIVKFTYDVLSQKKIANITILYGSVEMKESNVLNLEDSSNPKLDIVITTPIPGYSNIHLKGDLNIQKTQKSATFAVDSEHLTFVSIASLSQNHMDQTFTLVLNSPSFNWEEFRFILNHIQMNDLHFDVLIKNISIIKGSLKTTTSSVDFDIWIQNSTSIKIFTANKRNLYDCTYSINVNEMDIQGDIKANLKEKNTFKIESNTKTSWTKDISVIVDYDGRAVQDIQLVFINGNDTTVLKGKANYTFENGKIHIDLISSINEYLLTFFCNISVNENVLINIQSYFDKYWLNANFKQNTNEIFAHVYFNTPFYLLREVNTTSNIYKSNDFSHAHLHTYFRLNNKLLYEMTGNGEFFSKYSSGNFSISTPHIQMKNNNFTVHFQNNAARIVFYFNEQMPLNISYETSKSKYSVNVTIGAEPESQYLSFASFINPQQKHVYLFAELPSKKRYEFTVKLFAGKCFLEIQTPHERIPNLKFESVYDRTPLLSFKSNCYLIWNGHTISYEGSYIIQPRNCDIQTTVSHNEVKLVNIAALFKISGVKKTEQISCAFEFLSYSTLFRMKSEVSFKDKDTVSGLLEIETPFDQVPKLLITMRMYQSYDKNNCKVNGELSIKTEEDVFKTELDYENNNFKEINGKVSVHISSLNVLPVIGELYLKQKEWRNLQSDITLKFPNYFTKMSGIYDFHGGILDGKVTFDTPDIHKEMPFAGCISFDHPNVMNAEFRLTDNKVSLNYTFENGTLQCDSLLDLQLLNLKNFNIHIRYEANKITASYKWDRYSGNVSLVHSYTSNNVMLQAHITDTVFFKDPAFVTVVLQPIRNNYMLEMKYETKAHLHTASLIFTNDYEDLNTVFYVQSPYFGKNEIKVSVNKISNSLEINILDKAKLKNKFQKTEGMISVIWFGEQHDLKYNVNYDSGIDTRIDLSSPVFSEKLLSILFLVLTNGKSGTVNFVLKTGSNTYKANFELVNTLQKQGLNVGIYSSEKSLFHLNVLTVFNKEEIHIEASFEIMNMLNKALLKHRYSLPLHTEFNLISPFLPQQKIYGIINSKKDSFLAYIGNNDSTSVPFIHIEGILNTDVGNVYLIIDSPYLPFMKHMKMHGSFNFKYLTNMSMSFETSFISSFIPVNGANVNFVVNKTALDVALQINTSIKNFNSLGAKIYIPFSINNGLSSVVSIKFPYGQEYGLEAAMNFMKTHAELRLMGLFQGHKLGGGVKVLYGASRSFDIEFYNPFSSLHQFRANIMGNISPFDGNNVVNYVEWNNNRIELKYISQFEKDDAIMEVQLLTPFEGHDKYNVKLHYGNKDHSVAIATVKLPIYTEEIGLQYEFSFNSILDFLLKAKINVPFFEKFNELSLLLSNSVEDNYVKSIISIIYNNDELKVFFEGSNLLMLAAECNIFAKINNKEVAGSFYGTYTDNGKLDILLNVNTSLAVEHFGIYVTTNQLDEINAIVSYNFKEIINFYSNNSENSGYSLTIDNMWQPLHAKYYYNFNSQFTITSELCWNIIEKDGSTVGLHVSFVPKPENRIEFSSALKIPSREMTLNVVYQVSENIIEHITRFSWQKNRKIGYHFSLETQETSNDYRFATVVGVDLPFRSFEVNTFYNLDNYESLSTEILWDASADRTKKIDFTLHKSPQKYDLQFYHPMLAHKITLQLIKSNVSEIRIEYSPQKYKMIIIKTMYQKLYFKNANYKIKALLEIQHDASELNTQVSFETDFTEDYLYSHISLSHMNLHSGLINSLGISGIVTYVEPKVEININTTNNNLTVKGFFVSKDNAYYSILTEIKSNNRQPFGFGFIFNQKRSSIDVLCTFGHTSSNKISIAVPNKREISVMSFHTIDGMQVEDGLIMVKLNSSQLLWTKVKWNIAAFNHLKENLIDEYNNVTYVLQSVVETAEDILDEDFLQRFELFLNPLRKFLFNLPLYAQNEMSSIHEDVQASLKEITEIYRRNDFYMKDIFRITVAGISTIYRNLPFKTDIEHFVSIASSSMKNAINNIYDFIVTDMNEILQAVTDLQNVTISIAKNILESLSDLYYKIKIKEFVKDVLQYTRIVIRKSDEYIQQIMKCTEAFISSVVKNYIDIIEPYIIFVQETVDIMKTKLAEIDHQVEELIDNFIKTLIRKKNFQWFIDIYATYATWLEELHLQDWVENMFMYINAVTKRIFDDILKILGCYNKQIEGNFSDIMNITSVENTIQHMKQLKKMLNNIAEKLQWMWQYYEISDYIEGYIHRFALNIDRFLLRTISIMDETSMTPSVQQLSTSNFIIEPEFGHIEYSVPLPGTWEGFDEIPKFEIFPEFQKTFLSNSAYQSRSEFELMRNVYDALHNATLTPILPPFRAIATIAGKHFITFDKVFYDFAGDSTYLLASDLLDSKFSLLVSYSVKNQKVTRKSLIFIADNHHIDINMNKKRVLLDGRKVEFPIQVGNHTHVTRSEEHVTVYTDFGVQFQCNLYYDICMLEVNGWYFGKTGGLFGTFDNEPSNDIIFPNGTSVTDIKIFANSWTVGSKCSEINYANFAQQNVFPDDNVRDQCSDLFENISSPLKKCFSKINPAPFYSMCVNDMTSKTNDIHTEKDKCLSVATYVTQCEKVGLEMQIPSDCVQCSMQDGDILQDDEVKVYDGNSPKSADVVFVVQQAKCINNINFEELSDRLDIALRGQKLTGVRYSVIGFGDSNFHSPQYYTANGEIWANYRTIGKSFKKLKSNIVDSTEKKSPFDALWLASRSSFRDGVSKTIILIQCQSCVEEETYIELSSILLENDITLHILEPGTLNFRKSSKNEKLFGIDTLGAYTVHNVKSLKPSTSLLRQVALPKDFCSVMAFETNGTFFNLKHYYPEQSTRSGMKAFIDVWANRVSINAKPSRCQQCTCSQNNDGFGQVSCKKCITPTTEEFLKSFAKKEEEQIQNKGLTNENISAEEEM